MDPRPHRLGVPQDHDRGYAERRPDEDPSAHSSTGACDGVGSISHKYNRAPVS